MGIVNSSNLDAANTAFEAKFGEIFSSDLPGVQNMLADEVPTDGLSHEFNLVDHLATLREWLGDKTVEQLRAYRQSIPLKTWEKTIGLKRTRVDYDRSGATGRALGNFVSEAAHIKEEVFFRAVNGNPVGYDGVALISTTHPHAPGGGVQSNSTNDNLSDVTLRAGINAMSTFRRENGQLFKSNPTHLVVHTSQQQYAAEILGSVRPVGVTAGGAWPASASAVAAVGIPNVVGGIQLVATPELADVNNWYLVDASRAGLKPWVLTMGRQPEALALTDRTDDPRWRRDEYQWSIEMDAGYGAGLWQLVYGKHA